MSTFTAQELSDFYQKVADGGEIEFRAIGVEDWEVAYTCPTLGSPKQWRIKPAKKVIDLSLLVNSQIDCEFSDEGDTSWSVGTLSNIHARGEYSYTCEQFNEWVYCRPRMNHKHAWDGGDCPIEGFVVRAWLDKEDFVTIHTSDNFINWNDFVYIEFLEVEHGYVMPWESE
mgnify:CR=1 FL=1|tara:strand:- start:1075 stop:1587 length:513 start_codon:yes stop_codon:yes gene_type:complete